MMASSDETWSRKIIVKNIPVDWPVETLEDFVEVVTNLSLDGSGVEYFNNIKHTALLTISHPISVQDVQNANAQSAQRGKQLEFSLIHEAPSSILVRGVTPNLTHDNLLYYFDSAYAGSQEGEVAHCKIYADLSLAVVTFSSHKVAADVLVRKTHTPSEGNTVQIEPCYDHFHKCLLVDQEEHFTPPMQHYSQGREHTDSAEDYTTVTNTFPTNTRTQTRLEPAVSGSRQTRPPPLKPKPSWKPSPHWAPARGKSGQLQIDNSSEQQNAQPFAQQQQNLISPDGIRYDDGIRRPHRRKRSRNKKRNQCSKQRNDDDENVQENAFAAMGIVTNSYQPPSHYRGRGRGRGRGGGRGGGFRGNFISGKQTATLLTSDEPGHESTVVTHGYEQSQLKISSQAENALIQLDNCSTDVEPDCGSVSLDDVELFEEMTQDFGAQKADEYNLLGNVAMDTEHKEKETESKKTSEEDILAGKPEVRQTELAKIEEERQREKERQRKLWEQEQLRQKQLEETLKMEKQALEEERQKILEEKRAVEQEKREAEIKNQLALAELHQKLTELKNRKKWTEECPAYKLHFMHEFAENCTICDIQIHEKDGTVDFTGTEDDFINVKCVFFMQIQDMASDSVSVGTEVARVLQSPAGRQHLDQLSHSTGCSYEIQESTIMCACASSNGTAVRKFIAHIQEDEDHWETMVSENIATQMQSLKQQLEENYPLALITLPNASCDKLTIDGIKGDVQLAKKGVEDYLIKNKPLTGVFQLGNALSVKAFYQWCTQELRQLEDVIRKNNGKVTVDDRGENLKLKYEYSKDIAADIQQRLDDIRNITSVKVVDLGSKFRHSEKSLVINGLHSHGTEVFCRIVEEKLKKANQETLITLTLPPKCVLPKLKFSREHRRPQASKPPQPRTTPQRPSRQPGQRHHHSHSMKPYSIPAGSSTLTVKCGDIASENVDGLVCVVGKDLDLQKTAVGQAIMKNSSYAAAVDQHLLMSGSAGNAGQVIRLPTQPSHAQSASVLYLAVLTNWVPQDLEMTIKLVVQKCLQSAVKEGITSLAIPPLGIGRKFQFPEDTIAEAMVYTVYRFLQDHPQRLKDVRLVIYDRNIARKFRETAKDMHKPQTQWEDFIPADMLHTNDFNPDDGDNSEDDDASDSGDEDNTASNEDEDDLLVFVDDIDDDEQTYPMKLAISPFFASTNNQLLACICVRSTQNEAYVEQALQKELRSTFVSEDSVDDLKTLKRLVTKSMEEIQTLAAKKDVVLSIRKTGDKEVLLVQGQKVCVGEVVNIIKDKIIAHNHHMREDEMRKKPRQGALPSTADRMQLPRYWTICQKGLFSSLEQWIRDQRKYGKLYDVSAEPGSEFNDILRLINDTWDRRFVGQGRDGRNLSHNTIKVEKVERLENPSLWEMYCTHRERLIRQLRHDHRGSMPPVEALKGSTGPILTRKFLPRSSQLPQDLVSNVNEHYLFHGTKKEYVEHIVKDGLDSRLASDNAMLGRGVYCSESSTKADQYTDDKQQRSSGRKTMILMRVLLGHAYINKSTNPIKYKRPPCTRCFKDVCQCTPPTHFDSVIDDAGRNFREFVVYDRCMCYPEYFITYQRM